MAFFGAKKNKPQKNKKLLHALIKGHKEMGTINIEIAEEGVVSDTEALENYESYLAESEQCDSKKGRHILR